MACGIICILSCWADRRCLVAPFKIPLLLTLLNTIAAVLFIALGIKAYWDHSGLMALLVLTCTIAAWFAVEALNRRLAKWVDPSGVQSLLVTAEVLEAVGVDSP